MGREKIENIFKVIENGNLYVGKCFDDEFFFINNKGEEYELNCIMYNSIESKFTCIEFGKSTFKEYYNKFLSKRIIGNYKIQDSEGTMIECFESIANLIDFLEQGTINECIIRKMA
ncbi:hypothetical protein [Clostridium saccharobutylicum]|uniref:Uncharacterized protein n=1 Tax=Clostridium saccharobutylicum TaxID=169679 RepID=A0A1S8MZ24_CLOSA|nr:hypothetical protein [Clostridium saccharobutylicum]OOM09444.1 hypothetical protein CLOSAC_37250 [Clostridium saccharobutylicum]